MTEILNNVELEGTIYDIGEERLTKKDKRSVLNFRLAVPKEFNPNYTMKFPCAIFENKELIQRVQSAKADENFYCKIKGRVRNEDVFVSGHCLPLFEITVHDIVFVPDPRG